MFLTLWFVACIIFFIVLYAIRYNRSVNRKLRSLEAEERKLRDLAALELKDMESEDSDDAGFDSVESGGASQQDMVKISGESSVIASGKGAGSDSECTSSDSDAND